MAGAPSLNDISLAILCELRILNLQYAEQNNKLDELDKLRADQAQLFPLLNTVLTPSGG